MDSDIHQFYHVDIQTGLSYTSGYCTGYIKLAEEMIEMLSSSAEDIENLIAENKKISAENKRYMEEMFKNIDKQ